MIFLVDGLGYGGSERTVKILCENLTDDVVVISITNDIKFHLTSNVSLITVLKRKYPGYIKIFLLPVVLVKLRKILIKQKPREVISFHPYSNLINIFLSKIIGYNSFINERQYSERYYGFKNIFFRPIISLFYNKANAIICNDEEIKESLIRYYRIRTPIYVLNNLFVIPDSTYVEILPKTRFRYITVGRLSNEKNTQDIIKAFARIDYSLCELVIVGNGPNMSKLKKLAEDLKINNNVIFIGHTPNPFSYLNTSDVFVFSSLNEGFPNVILEAMYFGLPIISYKFKAGITTILENGKYGILIPLHDIDLLASKMNEMKNNINLREKFSTLARFRVQHYMKIQKHISDFKKIIKSNDPFK